MEKRLFFLVVFSLLCAVSQGGLPETDTIVDKKPKFVPDTTYFRSYEDKIMGRVYFSQKSTAMRIEDENADYTLDYLPNTSFNLGVGATYKFATLNIAVGFGFLNPDQGQGKTKYLDLQFHSYGHKIMADVFGQFYNGFYLDPKGTATTSDKYYIRPDMSVYLLGASLQYVFNNRKFSYRSSFMQNEWQRKSAGSFLAGVEAYIGDCRFDSTAIPTLINDSVAAINYKRVGFFEAGPNIGYAHTFVIKEHFFLHGSATLGLAVGHTSIKGDLNSYSGTEFSPNPALKLAAGYNCDNWVINFLFTSSSVNTLPNDVKHQLRVNTSNFRLIYAKRFTPGKKVKKLLKPIDNMSR